MPSPTEHEFYRGLDPKEMPRYSIHEGAHYLHISPATLRTWVLGRIFETKTGTSTSENLIRRPHRKDDRLSFSNLVEAHVLHALRKRHRVSMRAIRDALRYVQRELKVENLLLSDELRAAPGTMFLERLGSLIDITKDGQLAMKSILEKYLERLDRNVEGVPTRFYPFTRSDELASPKLILIDPFISFGRPVVAKKAIKTSVIADRFHAGESIPEIANDYDLDASEVEEAIRYERAA